MTIRTTLARIWASSREAAKTQILDAKYDLGWIAEIPTFQNLNWLHNKIDNNQLSLAERGVFEWGSDVVYRKGALAWRETDGFIYVCLTEGTTEAPSGIALNWKRSAAQISRVEYDGLVANWNSHTANFNNPHKTTAAQLNAYTKAEIDALLNTLQGNLDTHANNKNNPHGTTAALAGAVPKEGGVYTGEVAFPSIKVGIESYIKATATTFEFSFKGNAIGVNSAGRPISRVGSATSNLLLEADYNAQRLVNEPDYGVPLPSFSMAAQTHLYPDNAFSNTEVRYEQPTPFTYTDKFGRVVTAKVDEPAFNKDGWLCPPDCRVEITELAFPKDGEFTISVKAVNPNPGGVNTGTSEILRQASLFVFRWPHNTNVTRFFVGPYGNTVYTDYPRSGKYLVTLTMVFLKTEVRLFQDGILLGVVPPPPAGTTSDNKIGFPPFAEKTINSIKMWHVALTDKQVSTL